MKLTQEQAEQVVAYAQELAGDEVEITIADVVEAVSSYDAAAQQWISAVTDIMERYDVSEAVANAGLAAVLDDHQRRGELWSAAVEEIIDRDGVSEDEANQNLLNLLRSLDADGKIA